MKKSSGFFFGKSKRFRLADEIQHLTSVDFQRRLLADRSTKLELILAGKTLLKRIEIDIVLFFVLDEEKIREITENLSQIESFARVLDEKTFQGAFGRLRTRIFVL